uniref:Transposase n=1 Tax=Caenorhabditis tropicalis TaxID=1561998 RepID=A0A1I7UN23_9PELO
MVGWRQKSLKRRLIWVMNVATEKKRDRKTRQGSKNASRIEKCVKDREMRQGSKNASRIEKCVKDREMRQGSRNASRIENCVNNLFAMFKRSLTHFRILDAILDFWRNSRSWPQTH